MGIRDDQIKMVKDSLNSGPIRTNTERDLRYLLNMGLSSDQIDERLMDSPDERKLFWEICNIE